MQQRHIIYNFIQLDMFQAIVSPILRSTRLCLQLVVQGESLARGPKLLSMYTVEQRGFLFVNTGKQVHSKHARRHLERNLVKDVHHRSVASRNWVKS